MKAAIKAVFASLGTEMNSGPKAPLLTVMGGRPADPYN